MKIKIKRSEDMTEKDIDDRLWDYYLASLDQL